MLMRPNQYETSYASLPEMRTETSFLSRAMKKLEEYAEHRRQRVDLLTLDDHMLKDIGISRADADRLAGRPFKWV
jgi:uncharacterized protein YjiS (DUF1127 family)